MVGGNGRASVLSSWEEAEGLFKRYWKDRNDGDRNRLVEAYLSYAEGIGHNMWEGLPKSVDRSDIMSAAGMGLLCAVKDYDLSFGVRFTTYLTRRVRGAVLDRLRELDWLPRPFRTRAGGRKRLVDRLEQELGREITDADIIERGKGELVERPHPVMPAGANYGEEEDNPALDHVPVEFNVEDRVDREYVCELRERLNDQSRMIIYLKYWEELPMREIGRLMGLSESRVCRVHAEVLSGWKSTPSIMGIVSDMMRDRDRVA